MPLRPSRSEASTSALLVPMLETIPIPVTTTRRMALPSESVGGGEQSHLQVLACVDIATVDLHHGVGDTHHQLAQDHALHADAVGNFLCARQHLAAELDLAAAERASVPLTSHPAQMKTDQLPHCIQPQASRHHRVALEMADEKPEFRAQVELGDYLALAEGSALVADVDDAIEHQHGREGQLRIAGAEHLPAPAGEQLFVGKTGSFGQSACFLRKHRSDTWAANSGPSISIKAFWRGQMRNGRPGPAACVPGSASLGCSRGAGRNHIQPQARRSRRRVPAQTARFSNTIASAAMPSARPANPSPSVLVALMLTWPRDRPKSPAILFTIEGICGAIFGAWAMIVASILTMR